MAKKVNIDDIDAEFIINSFSSHTVAPSTPPPKQESREVSVEVETKVIPTPIVEPKAEQPRKRKSKSQDYEECFLKRSEAVARQGKTIYIRKEYLKRIQKILPVISTDEISVFNYIDNILSNHFDSYENEITELYNKNNQPIFQKE